MRHAHRIAAFQGGPSRQKGMIATLIALVVLVVTLIAVIALMHSVDSANTIAGSLSFRQAVLQEADRAYTDAKNLSVYSPPGSDSDGAGGTGYFAEVQPASTVRKDLPDAIYTLNTNMVHKMDPSAVDIGNTVYYMVERLCPANGAATLTTCIVPGKALTGGTSSNTTSDPGIPFNTTGSAAAYRLTVRVEGPKNSIAFVQTILR